MLTELADWQRASFRGWLTLGRATCLPFAGPLAAIADLALLNLEVGEATERDLRAAVERDAGRPVELEVILDHPFAAVVGAAPRRLAAATSRFCWLRPTRATRRPCSPA